MKLYYAPTSPYARKVLAIAHEKGLAGKLEKLPAREPGVNLFNMNPLDKVPTLVTDDGDVLIESALISQYLDEIGGGRKLYPAAGKARWRMLQHEAVGQGVLDAGVLCRMEGRMHKPEMISAEWIERQQKKIKRGLPMMEKALDELGTEITPAHITYGATLFFFEQHKLAPGWREAHPKLAKWYDEFARQPCMATTAPVPA